MDDAKIYRLTDMDIEEVSIVDRAANKRKFLVVKSEDGMSKIGAQVVPDGRGGMTTVVDKAPTPPAAPAPAAEPAPSAESEKPAPAAMQIAPEIKKEILRRIDAASAKFDVIKKLVESAQDSAGTTEVPPEVVAALSEAIEILASGGAGDAPAPAGAPPAQKSDDAVAHEAVSKGLKQFSGARLGALQSAYAALGALLGDVTPAAPAEVEAPAVVETAEKTETETAPAPDLVALVAKLEAAIAAGFTKMADVVQAQHASLTKQAEQLATLQKSVSGNVSSSNAGPESLPVPTKKAADEPWPMDMAK